MRKVAILGMGALMALGACAQPAVDGAVPHMPAITMAGVRLDQPLSVMGTEPFWTIRITDGEMAMSRPEGGRPVARHQGVTLSGGKAVMAGRDNQGQPVEVTLTPVDCSDGMSDRTYPLTASVRWGGLQLSGCAASSAALQRAGESGRVD